MFTIPDKGEGQNDIQSILFQEALDIIVAGIDGTDCVLFGGACTAQGSPDMTVAVAKGAVLTNRIMKGFAAANATISAANATNPRLDYIVINSSGAIAVRAGTAAAAPKPPNRTANDVVLAQVYIPANDTTISTDQITDRRVTRSVGPISIYEDHTSWAVNTNAGAQTLLTMVCPNGLLATAGKRIRGRIGGNILHNSGTMTVTLSISYGGTAMYTATSTASTNDPDRAPWVCDFELIAQASNDQTMSGYFGSHLGAVPTATAGFGGLLAGALVPFGGGAAVDSDSADRTLLVTMTMSVSNAADEIVFEHAQVYLA